MDLRPYIRENRQIDEARDLIREGRLNYQPYIFADDLETGVGYEFIYGEYKGMVYDPVSKLQATLQGDAPWAKFLIAADDYCKFHEANKRLRATYDGFVRAICDRLGDISTLSFADIGCNSGYFPLSFAMQGAGAAVGYDRVNYGANFRLLNGILGTNAEFIHKFYHSTTQSIPEHDVQYDVVLSCALLCHLPDPLQYLAFLGRTAKRALFIWTGVTREDRYSITFGEPNKYYQSDPFPLCFDNLTSPSMKLLVRSLELMGFTQLHEIPNSPDGMPTDFYDLHAAILAIRP